MNRKHWTMTCDDKLNLEWVIRGILSVAAAASDLLTSQWREGEENQNFFFYHHSDEEKPKLFTKTETSAINCLVFSARRTVENWVERIFFIHVEERWGGPLIMGKMYGYSAIDFPLRALINFLLVLSLFALPLIFLLPARLLQYEKLRRWDDVTEMENLGEEFA